MKIKKDYEEIWGENEECLSEAITYQACYAFFCNAHTTSVFLQVNF